MAKTTIKSCEEKQKEAWFGYFKNIQKENDLIRVIFKYYRALEIDINKINSNSKNNMDERYEDNTQQSLFAKKTKEESSILPKYVEYINRKELRQYLSKVIEKIDNFNKEVSNSEISVNADIKKRILYFYELIKKLNELKQETQNSKPQIDKNKFTSLYLENFKGFAEKENKEENTIKIRPVTLIYGPNSYGKSSILQSLLLLNQTVRESENFENTALLSQGNTVTLGKFKNFINKNDIDKELKIEISIPFNHYFDNEKEHQKQDTSLLAKLFFCYCFKYKDEQVILSAIDISAKIIDYYNTEQIIETQKKLLYTLKSKTDKSNNIAYDVIRHFKDDISPEEIFLGDTNEKEDINKTSFFRFEEILAEKPFEQIEKIIKNIIYVSSFRKSPERYYVPDDNTRKYVGKSGEYTAGILSYDKEIQDDVNNWLSNIVGYKLASGKNKLDSKKNKSDSDVNSVTFDDDKTPVKNINLLDLGSGIAQVLPIITQAFESKNETILIEEPEIHLHPKAQAELGEMFAVAATKNENTFIIETHSENLLLRLQKLIRRGELSKDHVSVIYVDKNENGSYCIPLDIDDDGDITNINDVPDGFFEEGFNELFDIKEDR